MDTYNDNNVKELLNDDKFVKWAICPSSDLELYWNDRMEKEPHIKKEIATLKRMITHLRVEEPALSVEDKEGLWQNILQREKALKPPFYSNVWFKVASVAAVLIPVIVGSFFFFYGNSDNVAIDYNKLISQLSKEDVKTSKEVSLILADNRRINIENDSEIICDNEGNLYANSKKIDLYENQDDKGLNQLLVPNGKNANIKLCDGTRVCVNSGSHLIFPTSFKNKNREIYIDGEIFLNVTKNAKHPFVVKTDKMDVQVLGTSFNVSAYRNEEKQSVVLVMGAVEVNNKEINSQNRIVPNQMYNYEKHTGEMNIRKVDVYDYICWQYGFLHFSSEKLSVVLSKLQRYYDIKMDYDETLTDKIFVSGKLDLKDNIQHVLNIISVTAPIKYEMQNNNLKIEVKP